MYKTIYDMLLVIESFSVLMQYITTTTTAAAAAANRTYRERVAERYMKSVQRR